MHNYELRQIDGDSEVWICKDCEAIVRRPHNYNGPSQTPIVNEDGIHTIYYPETEELKKMRR